MIDLLTLIQVNYGMGRHFDTLSVNDKIMLFKWFWASVWIYYTSLCFTKLSILLQLLRVFTDNKFRIACYVLMGVSYHDSSFHPDIFTSAQSPRQSNLNCLSIQSFTHLHMANPPAHRSSSLTLSALSSAQSSPASPVSYFWDKTIEGSCVDQTAVWFSNTAINIVTDICTAVLPIPTLKSLQLPKRQKYALMAVFCAWRIVSSL